MSKISKCFLHITTHFASVLAKCAPKDKYFNFVKLILTNQEKWISNDNTFMNKLRNIGKLAGLNENKINSCFKDEKMVDNIDKFRGKFGYFFEYEIDEINEIARIVNNKYQTLTYFGINKMALKDFVLENSLLGIDRIVPVGQAMDMGVIWDGYDIIRSLSRIVEVK